jgi:hypothetical protein
MALEQLEKELAESAKKSGSKKKHSVTKWILIFFIVCFCVVIVGGGFLIWSLLFKESNFVGITLQAEKTIMRGIPFSITAIVSNDQDIAISESKLSLMLPDGVREANTGGSLIAEPIGIIQGGTSVKKTFSLVSTNAKGDTQEIEARISYVGAGNNRFEPNGTKYTIETNNEPLSVAVALPDTIVRGSPFSFEIQYANPTSVDAHDIWLVAEYPSTFHFDRASQDPDLLTNRWRLPNLQKGAVGSIEITGTYEGDDSSPLTIPVSLVLSLGDRDYVIASSKSSKEPQASPVTLRVLVNGVQNYIAKAGDTLSYSIQYENRAGIALRDTVVSLSFSGAMVNASTLSGSGTVNKRDRSVEWNAENTPVLSLLSAGATGEFSATVKLNDVFPIKKASDKNFSVIVRAKLESPSVPPYMNTLKTSVSANEETKIGGSLNVASELRYRDPDSGIANGGPFPPKAGQATEYTVHWILETGATDIKDVEIVGELEDGVQFSGISKSNIETKPEYDSVSKSMRWKIPRITSGRGVISDLIEATFQVRAIPTEEQVKQFMPIMKETIAKGTDEFTDVELVARDVALSTSLPDDSTVGAGGGRVQ